MDVLLRNTSDLPFNQKTDLSHYSFRCVGQHAHHSLHITMIDLYSAPGINDRYVGNEKPDAG